MDWIYEDPPYTDVEKEALTFLNDKFKDKKLAEVTIKALSLYRFLKDKKFETADEVIKSTFFDALKTKPIFNEQTAESVLYSFRKIGGSNSKYPFTDYMTKITLNGVSEYLPDIVTSPIIAFYELLSNPILNLKDAVPLTDLGLTLFHGSTETGVTVAGDVAEGVGGPVGAAVALPITGAAALIASSISILEQDFGQAIAHIANAIPIMGSAVGKALTQMEHVVENLEKHQTISSYIPIVGTYVTQRNQTKKIGGKRFSTFKTIHNKWRQRKSEKP